jgi:hypothetical protein
MAFIRRRFCVRRKRLEGWGFVAVGDVGVVEAAFGGDGVGGVVGAGVAAAGHHRPALAGGFNDGWVVGPQLTGGCAQGGE